MKRASDDPSQHSFGEQLRQLREAAGMTQEALAERAGLTAKAIGALERGERRYPYPHTVQALAAALALTPEERVSLLAAVPKRPAPAATAKAPAAVSPNASLPVSISPMGLQLFGREGDVAAILKLLDGVARLLTLVGPGGVGKTRLAQEVAVASAGRFGDGAKLVSLAPLADAGLVLSTISHTLGLREMGTQTTFEVLSRFLRDKQLLLVLDNFEHVLPAAPDIAELLVACPNLVVLVTSRAALRVRAEQEYPVSPLQVPTLTRAPLVAEVDTVPAVKLFVERAQAVSPHFVLTQDNAAAVAAICRRLDGLPLALELAAARIKLLTPTALLARLDQVLPLLSGGARDLPERQQTIRRTIDWSYDLLDMAEQRLFRRLAVFAGGWDLDAAEVVDNTAEVLDVLGGLVNKSLIVVAEMAGERRYRLLEPMREYALERLEESDESEVVWRRHAAHYLAMAEQAYPNLRRRSQVEWLARLEVEHNNLRCAMARFLSDGTIESAARLGWALWPFWWIRNLHNEGRRQMELVLAQKEHLPAVLCARATMSAEAMAYGQGDGEAVEHYAIALMALSQEVGRDPHAEAYAHAGFGLIATIRGDFAAATAHLEQALPLFHEANEEGMAAQTHTWLGTTFLLCKQYEAAQYRFERGLTQARQLGDRLSIANALFNLAQLALAQGDYDGAARRFVEGISPSKEMGDWANIAYILEGLGVVEGLRKRTKQAVRLFGAAEGIIDRAGLRGHTYYRPDQDLYTRIAAEVRAQLDEQTFTATWEEGRSLPLNQAIAVAIQKQAEG